VDSTRLPSRSGGSIGRSASASIRSRSSDSNRGSLIARPCRLKLFLELLDGAVDQHLRRAVAAAERTGDLAVRHAQREAHDQRLAAIVGEAVEPRHDLAHPFPALD